MTEPQLISRARSWRGPRGLIWPRHTRRSLTAHARPGPSRAPSCSTIDLSCPSAGWKTTQRDATLTPVFAARRPAPAGREYRASRCPCRRCRRVQCRRRQTHARRRGIVCDVAPVCLHRAPSERLEPDLAVDATFVVHENRSVARLRSDYGAARRDTVEVLARGNVHSKDHW
jgi:hypothetical protein